VPEKLVALEGVVEGHSQHQNHFQATLLGDSDLVDYPGSLVVEPEIGRVPVSLTGVNGHGHRVHTDFVERPHPGLMIRLVDLDAP
jgi:hypothetical protein